jgi:hypothetical protein
LENTRAMPLKIHRSMRLALGFLYSVETIEIKYQE